MTSRSSSNRDDRILVRDGRRHHRRTYSPAEFRIGIGVLAALTVLLVWVAWRGANPDPALFGIREDLLTGAVGGEAAGGGASADRGPFPPGLAAAGWTEGPVSTFDPTNLYVKINGREDYYKSFGFRRLWFVSIASTENPQIAIDVEAYDLGETANALGAYAGERGAGVSPVVSALGLEHLDRNALYLTRGPWYVRALGSDESPPVLAQLERLRVAIGDALPGEPLPWAYALFVGAMGLDPGQVSYSAENAFSFGFAKEVYSALLEDETEPFVVAGADAESAAALAGRFHEAFREYGRPAGETTGVAWTADRWIDTIAGAKATGRWTLGVRGAPDVATAERVLSELEAAVAALPEIPADTPAPASEEIDG